MTTGRKDTFAESPLRCTKKKTKKEKGGRRGVEMSGPPISSTSPTNSSNNIVPSPTTSNSGMGRGLGRGMGIRLGQATPIRGIPSTAAISSSPRDDGLALSKSPRSAQPPPPSLLHQQQQQTPQLPPKPASMMSSNNAEEGAESRSSGGGSSSGLSDSNPLLGKGESPRKPTMDAQREQVLYLEGMVSSLQTRIAQMEQTNEALTAELEELRNMPASGAPPAAERASQAESSRASQANNSGDIGVLPRSGSFSAKSAPIPAPSGGGGGADTGGGAIRRSGWVGTRRPERSASTVDNGAPAGVPSKEGAGGSAASTPTQSPALVRANTVSGGLSVSLGGRRREVADERTKAMEKLVDGERKYCMKLGTLSTLFLEPIRNALSDVPNRYELMYALFANAEALVSIHKILLSELLARFNRWTATTCIADVLTKFAPIFYVYVEFVRAGVGSQPIELGAGPHAAKVQRIIALAETKNNDSLSNLLGTVRGRVREYVGSCIFLLKATEQTHADYAGLQKVRTDLEEIMHVIYKAAPGGSADSPGLSSSSRASEVREGRSGSVAVEPDEQVARGHSATLSKIEGKKAKKGGLGISGLFSQSTLKGDRTKDQAQEIRARILADIQEREKDPNLTEEERGALKLQAAFAQQGKFNQALNVMANPDFNATGKVEESPVRQKPEAVTAFSEDEAFAKLLDENSDAEFERVFLGMYMYFVSWKTVMSRMRAAYLANKEQRPRVFEILSKWLELNPELRHVEAENGPKKKSKQQQQAASVAPAATETKATTVPSPPQQQSETSKKVMVTVIKKVVITRTPNDDDGIITDMCNQIIETVVDVGKFCGERNDQQALLSARACTEMTIQLVNTVKESKGSEPAFLQQAQDLRGGVVSLTQRIISVIKAKYEQSVMVELEAGVNQVKAKCSDIIQLAGSTEVEAEVEEQEEREVAVQPASSPVMAPADGTPISPGRSASPRGGGDGVYQVAMTATNAVHAAPLVKAIDEGNDHANFLAAMDAFCKELDPSGTADQAFVAFFKAWLQMGTAAENLRKNAKRQSAMFTRGQLKLSAAGTLTCDLLKETTPVKLAQQMAILEYRLFQVIPTQEFLLCRFMDASLSPNFATMVNQFNLWGRFAYSEVLRRAEIDERVRMISFFINVAKESLAMNNFNSSYALVAGLNFPGLSRLKQTWARVNKRDMESYQSLLDFWSTSRNYKTYRAALKAAPPPAVPWFGLVSKDLFHVEDATPTFAEDGKINFNKLSIVWNAVSFLHTLQKYEYVAFTADAHLQQILADVKYSVADENEGYTLSYKYEAKGTTGGGQ